MMLACTKSAQFKLCIQLSPSILLIVPPTMLIYMFICQGPAYFCLLCYAAVHLEFTYYMPNIMLKAGSQSCRLVAKYIKSAQYVTKHLYDSLTQFDVRGEEGHLKLRKGRHKQESWMGPTNFVQSVPVGLLHVERAFSMHSMLLLGGMGHVPKITRYNEIEFGSNFDCNVTLVLKATCTINYISYYSYTYHQLHTLAMIYIMIQLHAITSYQLPIQWQLLPPL